MKGNKKVTVIAGAVIVAVMLTIGASILYAQFGPHWGPGCMSPEERAAWISERLTKRLELSDAQRQDLDTMLADLGGKRKEMRDYHEKGRDELLGILRQQTFDRDRVKQLVAEHRQVIGDTIGQVTDRLTEFAATLSPEQRARLADAIEEHSAFHHVHGQ